MKVRFATIRAWYVTKCVKAVLKKPLHTSIAVNKEEFDEIEVADKLHIIVSVKDFKAILLHAQMTSGELSACYSNPGHPMKLSYGGDGILCEFVLMTVGERHTAAQRTKKGRINTPKPAARPVLEPASNHGSSVTNDSNPPPRVSQLPPHQRKPVGLRQTTFDMRPPPLPPQSTLRSDSLFVPQPDEDQQWEPVNLDENEEEPQNSRLGWDAGDQQVSQLTFD